MADGFHVVTGAFGYSGRWITKLLLDQGGLLETTNLQKRRWLSIFLIEHQLVSYREHGDVTDGVGYPADPYRSVTYVQP